MTYQPTKPLTTDNLSVSQGDISTNFTQLNSQFGIDHNAFATGGVNGNGHHKQVTYDNVSGVTPSTISAYPMSGTYTKAFGTDPNLGQELYFAEKRQAKGTLEMYVPGIKVLGQIAVAINGGGPGVPGFTLQTNNTLNQNINTFSWNAASQQLTINFTTALDYATYFAFFFGTPNTPNITVSSRSTSSITLQPITNPLNSGLNYTFGIMIF